MVTVKELRELEGKKVIMWTKNGSIYLGEFKDVKATDPSTARTPPYDIANVTFDYIRYSEAFTIKFGKQKAYAKKHKEKTYPIRKTDKIYPFDGKDPAYDIVKRFP